MFQKLDSVETRCNQLDELLSDTEVINDQQRFQLYAKERSSLSELLETYQHYKKVCNELEESEQLALDPDEELKALAKTEAHELKTEKIQLEEKLRLLLLPKDPRDEKNILIEIRAGTGGRSSNVCCEFIPDVCKICRKREVEC